MNIDGIPPLVKLGTTIISSCKHGKYRVDSNSYSWNNRCSVFYSNEIAILNIPVNKRISVVIVPHLPDNRFLRNVTI